MRNEPQKVGAVDRGVAEACSAPVPVRVQATTANLHHLAGPALLRQGIGANLPGDRGGVVQRVIEAARGDVQASVCSAGIGGTERVELLDRTIGVDHDKSARQKSQTLYRARLAEHKLYKLAEQADPRFLPRCGVPAFEDADQPVCVTGARWRAAPVGMRQQEVKRRGVELQQRLKDGNRVVVDIDRAQYAAVTFAKLR